MTLGEHTKYSPEEHTGELGPILKLVIKIHEVLLQSIIGFLQQR